MTTSEWKVLQTDLIHGVEQELGAPIPTLESFRARLNEKDVARKRKQFERDLEAFLQSKPFLRAATERYLRKKAQPALEAANIALEKAEKILAQYKSRKSRTLPN